MDEKDYLDASKFVEEDTNRTLLGNIASCNKLRVRSLPEKDSEVLLLIDRDTEFAIDESESTEEFYKIYTASGIEGYCVRKFIEVKEI